MRVLLSKHVAMTLQSPEKSDIIALESLISRVNHLKTPNIEALGQDFHRLKQGNDAVETYVFRKGNRRIIFTVDNEPGSGASIIVLSIFEMYGEPRKTNNQSEVDRIHDTFAKIEKLRNLPEDRPLRLTLTDGSVIEGRITGGALKRYLKEVDKDAAVRGSDLGSGEAVLTDHKGIIHRVDLLNVQSVDVAG